MTDQFEKGLRSLAQEIADATGVPIMDCREQVMSVLRREIGPLLEAAEHVASAHDLHPQGELRKELAKWKK